MRLLLDTHALIWWLDGAEQLSETARTAIGDPSNEVYVSAATAWEVATKARIGKLPGALLLAQGFGLYLEAQGFHSLAITIEHARRAGLLPGPHKDPFDRMLIAQAQVESAVLVSNEEIFDQYGVVRLWK